MSDDRRQELELTDEEASGFIASLNKREMFELSPYFYINTSLVQTFSKVIDD